MSDALALPAPSSLAVAELQERCAAIAGWADGQTDIRTVDEARAWLAAVERYLAKRDAAGPAASASRMLEARIGELLGEVVPGQRTDLQPSVAPEGSHVTKDDRHDFRLMARYRPLWEPLLPLSRREVLRIVRRASDAATPSLAEHAPGATYRTIVIDPPWDPADEGDADQMGRAQPGYGLMPLAEVRALPVADLADPDGCHLYLWITNRSLPKGFGLLEAWGFRYVTALTWCKPSIGVGNYFRNSTEHVLFGVRGSLQALHQDVGTWFAADRQGPHSTKPDGFYAMAARVSPGPRIDVFARRERAGFALWGADAEEVA